MDRLDLDARNTGLGWVSGSRVALGTEPTHHTEPDATVPEPGPELAPEGRAQEPGRNAPRTAAKHPQSRVVVLVAPQEGVALTVPSFVGVLFSVLSASVHDSR